MQCGNKSTCRAWAKRSFAWHDRPITRMIFAQWSRMKSTPPTDQLLRKNSRAGSSDLPPNRTNWRHPASLADLMDQQLRAIVNALLHFCTFTSIAACASRSTFHTIDDEKFFLQRLLKSWRRQWDHLHNQSLYLDKAYKHINIHSKPKPHSSNQGRGRHGPRKHD